MSAGRRLRAAWYYLRSFFRPTWTVADYPVSMWSQGPRPNPEDLPPPMRGGTWYPYIAWIDGTMIMGFGDSPDEARASLAKHFDEYRGQNELPRPGSMMKLGQLAVHERIRSQGTLRDEFIERILRLDPAETFVSDLSSLSDFDPDVGEFDRRLRLLYRIDIDQLTDDRLVTILDAIAGR
jgi:hypothetical protein